jgi:hypothetical protein
VADEAIVGAKRKKDAIGQTGRLHDATVGILPESDVQFLGDEFCLR